MPKHDKKFILNETNQILNETNQILNETNQILNETNQMNKFPKFYFVKKLYMFRAFPLPIIRIFLLYIRHWYISCRFDDSFQAGSS